MVGEDVRTEVVAQLNDALAAEESDEKDFHVRQALQLLEVDDED
jgi:hypothetical protein